jgi:hypothetical protein
LDSLFGKVNEFQALQLEAELSLLVPDEHASIEYYLSKFKLLLAQLKGCGKTKINDECIFLILSKLKGPFRYFLLCFTLLWMHLEMSLKCPLLIFYVSILLGNSLRLCN